MSKTNGRRTHFVPKVVFRTAFAGVVPACVAAVACGGQSQIFAVACMALDGGPCGVPPAPDASNESIEAGFFSVAARAFDAGPADASPMDASPDHTGVRRGVHFLRLHGSRRRGVRGRRRRRRRGAAARWRRERLKALAGIALERSLTRLQKQRIRSHAARLLTWQRTLDGWPTAPGGLPAAPFVSVYAGGVLRGCFGCAEGPARNRLSRAFLRALEDSRYGLVRAEERGNLAVVVSYATGPHAVNPEQVGAQIEAGTEGLGVIQDGRVRAMLLPHVTRDLRAGPRDFLAHLGRKAGVTHWGEVTVFAFRTEDVIVRAGARRRAPRQGDARVRAAAWLARLVAPDGTITFAVDPRKRERFDTGPMHHGRAAVVVRALEGRAGHARAVARARAWLRRAIEDALRGDEVEGWPADSATQAGTLALAHRAGIDCGRELTERAGADAVLAAPWHGAQVAAALGPAAPEALWRACVRDLSQRPWAPWTVLAARARGDTATIREGARALVASLRSSSPNEGGCSTTEVPETALTALVVEALDGLDDADARDAVRRGRRFLTRLQLLGEDLPAPLDPNLADGAFSASPVVDLLRCDIVAHALLALGHPS